MSQGRIVVITGSPGTGKSTTAYFLVTVVLLIAPKMKQ